jgi:hypothetical protein
MPGMSAGCKPGPGLVLAVPGLRCITMGGLRPPSFQVTPTPRAGYGCAVPGTSSLSYSAATLAGLARAETR